MKYNVTFDKIIRQYYDTEIEASSLEEAIKIVGELHIPSDAFTIDDIETKIDVWEIMDGSETVQPLIFGTNSTR